MLWLLTTAFHHKGANTEAFFSHLLPLLQIPPLSAEVTSRRLKEQKPFSSMTSLHFSLVPLLGARHWRLGYLKATTCVGQMRKWLWASWVVLVVKNPPASAGDTCFIPGSGRSPGVGNGNPLLYLCLENPMDRGAWWATVCGVAKSRTRLRGPSMHARRYPRKGKVSEKT